jgi:B12 binding domain/Radical SAM superfamily
MRAVALGTARPADLTGLRVTLVHANPWQAVRPVPPYGLHRLRTALEESGADVTILDPWLHWTDFEADVAVEHRIRELEPDLVGFSLRVVDTLVPVETTDGAADGSDSSPLLPRIRDIVRAARLAAPRTPFVVGGAAFPTHPQAILDHVGVDLGILGSGEAAIVDLADRIRRGASLDGVDGLVRRGVPTPVRPAMAALAGPTCRDPLFAPVFSVPVRTRTGCGMFCSYCTSANLQGMNGTLSLDTVFAEVGAVVAKAHALGEVPEIHFADEELNLPGEDHAVALLQGILDRGWADRMTWTAYLNPRPFSDRLAELVKATHGRAEFTVDSAVDSVLHANRRPARRRHVDQLVDVLARHELPAVLNLMFGMPGETWETARRSIAWAREVPEHVLVSWGSGVRILPGLPVSRFAEQEPQHVYAGSGPSFTEPSLYSTLGPPREVALRLNELLDGHPQVPPMPDGETVWAHTGVLTTAYRLVAAGADTQRWRQEVVEVATAAGPIAPQLLKSAALIARWNGRADLADVRAVEEFAPITVHR